MFEDFLEKFTTDIRTMTELPSDWASRVRSVLREEEARRAALPYVAERENEIAAEWQQNHPPVVDEVTGLPVWKQPDGAHNAWPSGAVVMYEGEQWQNVHPAPNAWEPGNPQHQWVQLTFPEPEPDAPEHPAWVQPSGAHDAYPPGAVVEHDGKLWRNTHTAGNAWQPPTQWEEHIPE